MRAFVMMLSVAVLLASYASRADETKGLAHDEAQLVLDRVAKMPPAEQQAWLARLEQRAQHAARLTLMPADAVREEAKIAALLHQKLVTWRVLHELVEQTIRRERAASGALEPATGNAKSESAKTSAEMPRATRAASAKPQAAARAANSKTPPAGRKVEVNIDELAARIAGSNLGLRTIERDLDEKGTWNAARIEPLADRLKILVLRRDDLALFRELVSKEKRSAAGRLESPRSAISELGDRIFEARKLASGEEFQGTAAERQAELDRLDSLSRRLAELAGDKK